MSELKPGLSGHYTETVTKEKTAKHYGSGAIEVYATPAMIAAMEKTCMDSVQPFLGNENTTVGTKVCVEHLKATPLHASVTCSSELVSVNGRELVFRVTARDEQGLIGQGEHIRFVVNAGKFMQKISGK